MNCPKCNLPLNSDHAHRTYEEHDACRNALIDPQLPPLDVTEEDEAKAKRLFDGRPTSLITTREGLDTYALKITAENFCRERQLLAALSRISELEAELAKGKL